MTSILTPPIRQRIMQSVNAVIDLRPLGVVVSIDDQATVIREPQRAPLDHHYMVMDIETEKPHISMKAAVGEGVMAALNCTAAVVAAGVTFGGTATAPITGGASLLVTSIGYAATFASGASCANSALRTWNVLAHPGRNDVWDHSVAYQTTIDILDGVSLVGVAASTLAASRAIRVLSKAGVRIPSVLGGAVNRQERVRLTREMMRMQRPNITNKEIKELIRNGLELSRYPKELITSAALKTLKDSIGAGLSFLSSSLDGEVKKISIYFVSLIK